MYRKDFCACVHYDWYLPKEGSNNITFFLYLASYLMWIVELPTSIFTWISTWLFVSIALQWTTVTFNSKRLRQTGQRFIHLIQSMWYKRSLVLEKKGEFISRLGHNWSEWNETQLPYYLQDNERHKTQLPLRHPTDWET